MKIASKGNHVNNHQFKIPQSLIIYFSSHIIPSVGFAPGNLQNKNIFRLIFVFYLKIHINDIQIHKRETDSMRYDNIVHWTSKECEKRNEATRAEII